MQLFNEALVSRPSWGKQPTSLRVLPWESPHRTQWEGGFDSKGGDRGHLGEKREGRGHESPYQPPRVIAAKKITQSEDNYVTVSLKQPTSNLLRPETFDWQTLCEPLYKRREEGASVTVVPQVLQTVDVVNQSGLYTFVLFFFFFSLRAFTGDTTAHSFLPSALFVFTLVAGYLTDFF